MELTKYSKHEEIVSFLIGRMEEIEEEKGEEMTLFFYSTNYQAYLRNVVGIKDTNKIRKAIIEAWNEVHPDQPYEYKPVY